MPRVSAVTEKKSNISRVILSPETEALFKLRRLSSQDRQVIARVREIRREFREELPRLEAWLDQRFGGRYWDRERNLPATTEEEDVPDIEEVSSASWITDEVARLKTKGKIRPGIGQGKMADLLHNNMVRAARTGTRVKVLSAGHIANQLREWALWPVVD